MGHERREEHERARRGAGGNGGRDGDRDRDRGSASLLVVALGAAVIALALGIAAASQVVIARHRARNSADAGALAGAQMLADGAETACAAADRLVRENRGRMTACVVRGDTVTVTAEVRTRAGAVTQRARAGPVDATG